MQWGGERGAAQRHVLQPAGLTACTHISERHSHPERHSLPTASSGAIRSSLVCNPRRSHPPRAGTEQGAETGEVRGERRVRRGGEKAEELNHLLLIYVFSGSCGAPDQQTERFESVVCRSHGSRTAGRCSETETSLLSPPQAHHKAESRQARSPGEKGPELPLSGRIQHWEPLPGVHLEDRCNISCVHPASRACKQPPIPPCLGAGISSRSQPRCLQPSWAGKSWVPLPDLLLWMMVGRGGHPLPVSHKPHSSL